MNTRKQAIINALRAFVNQRPGFDYANYGSATSLRQDQRLAQRQRSDALQLLRDIELRDSITAEMILKEAEGGRVTLAEKPVQNAGYYGVDATYFTVDYCTGQYFPTAFRGAVARLCASVLWTWKRDYCMPEAIRQGKPYYAGNAEGSPSVSAGEWLRASFKNEYGRTLAGRYFT